MTVQPFRAALWLALAGAAGCSDLTDPTVERARILAENRDRWAAAGLQSYAFELRRMGAWMLEIRVRIVVTGTAIDSIIDLATGQPVLAPVPSPYQVTAEDLFDIIESGILNRAETVTATYDSASGFPTAVWIDYAESMDDEQGFVATLLTSAGP